MATSAKSDFDIFQSLWQNINDICVPKPPPGAPAKACFLMEMPGFSIDPKAYDPAQFDPSTMSSPDMEVATLCDRIPAIASYFYDTGDHISFLWNQLLTTYHVKPSPAGEDEAAKNNYDDALEMLYGGRDGYIKQTKTPLFANLEVLRKKWQDAMDARERFRTECLNDSKKWPKNFQDNAGPYNDQVDQEYTSYNNLRREIEKYEASILRYSTGDLTTLMLEQQNGKEQLLLIHKFNNRCYVVAKTIVLLLYTVVSALINISEQTLTYSLTREPKRIRRRLKNLEIKPQAVHTDFSPPRYFPYMDLFSSVA